MENYSMPAEQPAFVIESDSAADWAVLKIKQARSDLARLEAHHNRQIELARQECGRTEDYMAAALMAYFETVPYRQTKTQRSYALASGKLIVKQRSPKFERDDKALCEWLISNGYTDMVKQVQEPKWADLKPLTTVEGDSVILAETGEVVAGVTAVPRDDEFVVEC